MTVIFIVCILYKQSYWHFYFHIVFDAFCQCGWMDGDLYPDFKVTILFNVK